MRINKDQTYAVYRFYKNTNRRDVLKRDLSLDEARKFCEESPTKIHRKTGNFNSFVGFNKN